MSLENVELLRPVYEAWSRGDLRAGKELLDPQVESVWPAEFPSGGTYRGRQGHAQAMREWLSPWEDFKLAAEDFFAQGDRVVVPFRVRARGRESGVEVEPGGPTSGPSAGARRFGSRSRSTPPRRSRP